jgi:hypothetical protein
MKVYKFLDSKFGLKSITERRLKISRFDDLNDPFELIPYNLKNRNQRWALKAWPAESGNGINADLFIAVEDCLLKSLYFGNCVYFETCLFQQSRPIM